MSQFGKFSDFCRDSTLPVCNLGYPYIDIETRACSLVGAKSGGNSIGNLGVVILAAIAIIVAVFLILKAEKKEAAVGRREMQILLIGYVAVSFAEIFTIGRVLPSSTNFTVIQWFTGVHIGAITATFWVLLLNAIIGYQLLDDGTVLSVSLVAGSMLLVFLGTGYITMDSRLGSWTGTFLTEDGGEYRNYALYALYLLFPIVAATGYFILETVLVLHVLEEKRPMVLLGGSAILFAVGQVFDFVISVHICNATKGKIDGSLFQTLFTLMSVITLWYFWSSITEDVWVDDPSQEETSYA